MTHRTGENRIIMKMRRSATMRMAACAIVGWLHRFDRHGNRAGDLGNQVVGGRAAEARLGAGNDALRRDNGRQLLAVVRRYEGRFAYEGEGLGSAIEGERAPRADPS